MEKIFIGGSITIKELDSRVQKRLQGIMEKGFPVLVGDAAGVDKAVQSVLVAAKYRKVQVYCINFPRHNLGDWTTVALEVNKKKLTKPDYAKKDAAMANECDYGFMIWDGRSSGTVNNILNLLKGMKKCLVYHQRNHEFVLIRNPVDLEKLLEREPEPIRIALEKRLAQGFIKL